MKIVEIFRSIQGESTYAGLPCTFIRTAGCSLRCAYCDTDYALSEDSGQEISIESILKKVQELEVNLVEITGGEPLEQPETPELCQKIIQLGYTVLLETNGSRPIETLPAAVIKIMDIKTPSSLMSDHNLWSNLEYLSQRDEIKFVIGTHKDFYWSVDVCRKHDLFGKHTILFSPLFDKILPQDLAQWILQDKIPVRMQLQLHKYIWSPTQRGV
jgi:7-carboxy-7-deazaguanine synthase